MPLTTISFCFSLSILSLGDDNGFQLAKDYLKTVDFYQGLEKYLDEYDQDGWNDAMKQLMNQPHKGDGKS